MDGPSRERQTVSVTPYDIKAAVGVTGGRSGTDEVCRPSAYLAVALAWLEFGLSPALFTADTT